MKRHIAEQALAGLNDASLKMNSTASVKMLALCLGLTLASGVAIVSAGCGSSGAGHGAAVAGRGDAEVPDRIALRIRTCAADHRVYERSGDLAATFEVNLSADGQADTVALRDSTLNDESLEKCIASALRSLSERDLRGNRAGDPPLGSMSPESRALFGQVQALGCLASPPCLLALTFLLGAAYVTVHVVVVAVSEMSRPRARTAPTATAMPTTTAVPTVAKADDDEYERRCRPFFDECMMNQNMPAWNRKDFGPTKNCLACYRECKFHSRPRGVWPDYKCPQK
jgi:hypothetical protein